MVMKQHTVKQLAEISGVTVRALHHYDEIGLLKPSHRTDAGYRLYEEKDLMRLQQILLYRELDFSLEDIKQILDDPEFDLKTSLSDQKLYLLEQQDRYGKLIDTIDKTIAAISGGVELVTDAELYEGFEPGQQERYEKEVREKYGDDAYEESQRNVRKMTKAEWADLKQEGIDISQGMASLMDREPNDPTVQALIKRHHAMIEKFYACSAERYRGLANLYVEHPEFRAHYEAYAPDLADFMKKAMDVYADTLRKNS